MESTHDRFTDHFHNWEMRGRGWKVFNSPIYPEPPFKPFFGHFLPEPPPIDDGRRPTMLSSLFHKVIRQQEIPPVIPQREEEPEPQPFERDNVVELQASLPADLDIKAEVVEQMLLNLGMCRDPVVFELLGLPGRVSAQFAASPKMHLWSGASCRPITAKRSSNKQAVPWRPPGKPPVETTFWYSKSAWRTSSCCRLQAVRLIPLSASSPRLRN
jgi:hypothetical protein